MDTISKSNGESKNEFNILKSDPVITYDHMSESARNRYFGIKESLNKSPLLSFVLEEMLIIGLIILALFTCL